MADAWAEWPFEEVIDFQEGPGILAKDFHHDGIPLVRLSGLERGGSVLDGCNYLDPAAVEKRWAHFRLQQGDILLSTSASLGRIAVVGEEAAGAIPYTGIIRMRPRDARLHAPFIRYLLEGPEFQRQAEMVGVGSVIRHFGPMHLRRMSVQLPSLDEQRAIAHILGTLDDKIELNRRMSETLESIARALFQSWFVDFDPVRAKSEGRDTGLPKHIADLFPDGFEESELGEIPKGWTCAGIGDWTTALSGGTPSKRDPSLWNGDIPWISPKVMTSIHADEADSYVTDRALGNGTRLAPAYATLVMVRGMGLHNEVRVSQARRHVAFNQDVKALVAKGIEPSLLLFALLNAQAELLGRIETSGHGTGKLTSDVLFAHPITMPTAPIQNELARGLGGINERIEVLRDESRILADARDTLLPRLITGEFRVRDAERFTSANG